MVDSTEQNRRVTPRVAGAAIFAASVVVAVFSVLHLTSPAWGLLSAAALSAALAAGGLGVVWMSRTTWGAEPRPERLDEPAGSDPRRARRSALIYGIVLLVIGVAGAAACAWAFLTGSLSPEWVRMALVTVVAVSLGVAMIVFGRSPIAAPEDDDVIDEGADAAATADGWVRVSARDGFAVVVYSLPGGFIVVWLFVQLAQFPGLFVGEDAAGFVVAIVAVMIVLVGAALWMLRRFPVVSVHPVTRRLRAGGREIGWAELTAARVSATSVWPGAPRTLFLTLEGQSGVKAPLTLRRRDRLALSSAQRDVAIRMITESSIEMPRAAEDPEGRFSRFKSPRTSVVTRPSA